MCCPFQLVQHKVLYSIKIKDGETIKVSFSFSFGSAGFLFDSSFGFSVI